MLLFDQFFWDNNIFILMISVLYEFKHRITIDSVSVKKIKNVWLVTIVLKKEYCVTLVGTMHSKKITMYHGFSREPKKKCWTIHEKL